MNPSVISLRGVRKVYPSPAGPFNALDNVDLEVARGEFIAVVGRSGSGKSTLLNLLAGIDRASAGELLVDGASLAALDERALSAWRSRSVGIVFQFLQLLPTLTAAENVMLPMDFCGRWPAREREQRAVNLLERLDVGDQAAKLPGALSGGQQQRVAVARALANEPALLLADEPTGNLDSHNAHAMLELFAHLAEEGHTVLMVTHDAIAKTYATRSIEIEDGRIVTSLDD